MNRAEGTGFGIALVGHAALLAALSLGLLNTVRPKPPMQDPMEVMLVDKVALQSASPTPATEAPQVAEAPEVGPVEDAAPEPAPAPTPAPPQPKPAPAPPPKPAPTPAKPTPPAPAKPAPAKPAPPKPAAKPAPPAEPKPEKGKPKATALAADFLKGIPAEKTAGKGAAPRAAVVDAQAMAGLIGLIRSQVKPCYTVPSGGTDSLSIVTRLRLRLKPDGSIAVAPEVLQQLGVTPANQAYARQMSEAASRAIQRCAPYKLPAELYEGGWNDFILRFDPRSMN
ncbi:MAG: Cell division and transport-associated protein TolA [Rhizorhabdus sp.]|nr:Cell division and transport-associated protein TolA [Rhizorhabdus sp.]